MSDNLVVIKRIREAHNTIKGHLKLVGDTVTDIEALFSLQKAHAGWSLSSTEALAENQRKLQQTLSALEEGLKNHFGLEEKALPPLLGELLMLALTLEHQEIAKLIGKAKSMVTDTKLEGLSQEKLLSKKSEIQRLVSSILQKVEEHASKEETVLKMVQKALESKQSK
jgi:hemerythrin